MDVLSCHRQQLVEQTASFGIKHRALKISMVLPCLMMKQPFGLK
jgi:hypothetical protein